MNERAASGRVDLQDKGFELGAMQPQGVGKLVSLVSKQEKSHGH
jgi:hypothetical protein